MENLLPFLPFLQFVALAALAVFGLRWFIRRPRNVSQVDPCGVRTIALFSGSDAEFFRDDREDQLLVGVRLFGAICDGLAHRGIVVTNRRNVQCAQGADCLIENERFGLVLEYLDPDWLLSVDWAPPTAAERRHVTLTHQIFARATVPASGACWKRSMRGSRAIRSSPASAGFEKKIGSPKTSPVPRIGRSNEPVRVVSRFLCRVLLTRAWMPCSGVEAVCRQGVTQNCPRTSPPAIVARACHVARATVLLTNRTDPSARAAFTPPG